MLTLDGESQVVLWVLGVFVTKKLVELVVSPVRELVVAKNV
jgi:hypothetical protein